MYPNQNQYSIDYLNQIAPQPQKARLPDKKFLFLIGGGVLFIMIIGFFALSSGGTTPKQEMETLAARMTTLQTISNKAQINIKSGSLRGTNSNLTIFLSNANHDMVAPLKTNGVDTTRIDPAITKAENGEALSAKLEDARLNAVFDRTYAREMSYQLETVEALMKSIYAKTTSKSLKTFLESTNTNLQSIKQQLYDFNAANG